MFSPEMIKTLSPELKIAVDTLRAGKMVLMVDDEGRENEGDLVAAGEFVTPEIINFMITHARGILCMPMLAEKAQQLNLYQMAQHNTSPHETAFTISIEAKEGITTGVSADDRAKTFEVVMKDDVTANDIVRPGHMFPLVADPNGVLARDGHTEGSIDLIKMAGLKPVAAICEVLNEDGTMARMADLKEFAELHQIPLVSVSAIIEWRKQYDAVPVDPLIALVRAGEVANLPNYYGGEDFTVQSFVDLKGNEHLAIMKGDFSSDDAKIPLVRLHSECLTGDVLGSLRCDCGPQLHKAMKMIGESDKGVVIYLRGHEGRGIGLFNKISAYALQDQGLDTVEANHRLGFAADMRDWKVAGAILEKLGIKGLDLLTNNMDKVEMLEKQGFSVRNRVAIEIEANPHNVSYLKTKRDRMGHALTSKKIDQ
ncbi:MULTISPECIES: GTP cyclohydrolase II [Commensalibacter]|uniref:Multifunctional fusion protein n=2 Tax=Commensalibacter TaxID=1079922 RepID=W7DVZ0_9PROT|nr:MULTISPECIES: GTP cyclohydrolase II [Commensalibacter]EUK19225.1 3,4-dihydroxy-2-butanone 4-phosphate synthase [Commensalibacter papalotli (ex Servin-Garciduenas et al. 2014)]CAI3931550.1 3 [Commensalibacter papalotli (ex Botero et al. 2023)] [Commensalibacter papalotli (ex Botero et al. 2024)]CAI3947131.1 3 [Commensalibacter papalotli (ex Botero et al. 2023)] [Commensalibacter papalotli (ex Botero et al. 2024)]